MPRLSLSFLLLISCQMSKYTSIPLDLVLPAWYELEASSPLIECGLFTKSFPDEEVQDFLQRSKDIAGSCAHQTFRNFLSAVLSTFLSKTSINGLTGYGGMFLFSETQMRRFLNLSDEHSRLRKNALDLGAGNGDVTLKLGGLFENLYATEMSTVMQWRLRQKGITLVDALNWSQTPIKFDIITAFNLIDRHFNPSILLAQLRALALKSQCLVVISLVLPASQYVEFNPVQRSHRPSYWLKITGRTFEEQAHSFMVHELLPAGFKIVRFTKLPYLCEGDMGEPYYHLHDAVFLLEPQEGDFPLANASYPVVDRKEL
ncbi:unnamed protein product [Caenorhabditis auriculariae]|uniref:Methyltransferase-like protein 9 n=1 Tax=Caenorhabditis auriculariae TaxID=2777116 RepID=A0A8S1GY11_9PELO|nr:unnamed protein product [Caenorhabditis auriculariae]